LGIEIFASPKTKHPRATKEVAKSKEHLTKSNERLKSFYGLEQNIKKWHGSNL